MGSCYYKGPWPTPFLLRNTKISCVWLAGEQTKRMINAQRLYMDLHHRYYKIVFKLERHSHLHFQRHCKEILYSYPEIGVSYLLVYYFGFIWRHLKSMSFSFIFIQGYYIQNITMKETTIRYGRMSLKRLGGSRGVLRALCPMEGERWTRGVWLRNTPS